MSTVPTSNLVSAVPTSDLVSAAPTSDLVSTGGVERRGKRRSGGGENGR